ncbi:MAG: Type 1 glutamine amidotransferase-like domain-containing protein [Bacteroidota bacterium]
MKFYLSSYRLGNKTEQLKKLVPYGNIGYVPNALDFSGADSERRKRHIERDTADLESLGVNVELLDLRDYFSEQNGLLKKLQQLGAIFISGGNVFVLRQAMYLSGLDRILGQLRTGEDFLYAGYSAAGCVLSQDLSVYQIVDNATDTPYDELDQIIWEGLSFLALAFMPHWQSDHKESADIDREVQRCKQLGIPYQTLRDGEVLIIE